MRCAGNIPTLVKNKKNELVKNKNELKIGIEKKSSLMLNIKEASIIVCISGEFIVESEENA